MVAAGAAVLVLVGGVGYIVASPGGGSPETVTPTDAGGVVASSGGGSDEMGTGPGPTTGAGTHDGNGGGSTAVGGSRTGSDNTAGSGSTTGGGGGGTGATSGHSGGGGSGSTGTGTGTGTVTSSRGGGGGGTTSSTAPTSSRPPKRKFLHWIPFGPASPQAPTQAMVDYYGLQRDCLSAGDPTANSDAETAFWNAAQHACRALRSSADRKSNWDAAQQEWLHDGGSGFDSGDCRHEAVRQFMQALFEAVGPDHDLDLVGLGPTDGGLACPPDGLSLSAMTGAAKDDVTVSWTGSPKFVYTTDPAGPKVLFGDVPAGVADNVDDEDESAVVKVPEQPAGAPTKVKVHVVYSGGRDYRVANFTYKDAP